MIGFLVSLFLSFIIGGGIVGFLAAMLMNPSLSGWAVGWIAGFFAMAAFAILSAVVSIGNHPSAGAWFWIVVKVIIGLWLASRGKGYLQKSYQVIPNDPAAIGIVTIWDKVINCIKEAGKKFIPNWWPFNIGVIIITLSKHNFDGKVVNVSSKDPGVTLEEISYSITYEVDPKRPLLFLKNKRESGIDNQIDDIISQAIKGAFGKVEWQEATKGSESARIEIIRVLTGKDTLPNPDNNPNNSEFGIMIDTFSIKNVTSSMAKEAQKKEAQKLTAEGRLIDAQSVTERMKIHIDAGLSPEDAKDMINLRDNQGVTGHIVTIRGLQSQPGGTIPADAVDKIAAFLEDLGVEVSEEKRAEIEKKLPDFLRSQAGAGNMMNIFGFGGLLNTLGIDMPKHGANQQQTTGGTGETQGEKTTQKKQDENKPPTMTRDEAEKKMWG